MTEVTTSVDVQKGQKSTHYIPSLLKPYDNLVREKAKFILLITDIELIHLSRSIIQKHFFLRKLFSINLFIQFTNQTKQFILKFSSHSQGSS